jgi:MFS family permease
MLTKSTSPQVADRIRRRTLHAACGAHAVHDGMTDLIYVLLPLWQSQFGIGYAVTGLMRSLYVGVMAALQIQAGRMSNRWSRKTLLVAGTAIAGLGFLVAGQTGALAGTCIALVLGGIGASPQHPLASSMVADSHDNHGSRAALATYNFAGDIGKMLLPAAVGLALSWWSWQQSVTVVGLFGLVAACWLAWMIPSAAPPVRIESADKAAAPSRQPVGSPGFRALLAIGLFDSATRMGFLTFLPFVLKAKGATTATIGLALALLFIGGAAGKLACGYLGNRIGMMKTVWLTESCTALAILAQLVLPLSLALASLPLLGVALNGTSSVLYGSVPDLVKREQREHAFALFYTITLGSGAASPLALGFVSDHWGVPLAIQCAAGLSLLTLPLAWLVNRELKRSMEAAKLTGLLAEEAR